MLDDALAAGASAGDGSKPAAPSAEAYADAVATYLGLGVSRTADFGTSLATWSDARETSIANLFARQAIPMVWDFAEVNRRLRARSGGCRPFGGRVHDGAIGVALAASARAI